MMQADSSPDVATDNIQTLDARGLACPLPLLKAKQALRHLSSGECLRVLATDPGSLRDFKAFADLSDNTLIEQSEHQGVVTHLLQKA